MVSLANVQMTLHYIKDVRVQCVLCCVCAGMSLRARSTMDCVTAAGAVVCSTVCYIRQFDVHSYNPACAAWALPIWDFQAVLVLSSALASHRRLFHSDTTPHVRTSQDVPSDRHFDSWQAVSGTHGWMVCWIPDFFIRTALLTNCYWVHEESCHELTEHICSHEDGPIHFNDQHHSSSTTGTYLSIWARLLVELDEHEKCWVFLHFYQHFGSDVVNIQAANHG